MSDENKFSSVAVASFVIIALLILFVLIIIKTLIEIYERFGKEKAIECVLVALILTVIILLISHNRG